MLRRGGLLLLAGTMLMLGVPAAASPQGSLFAPDSYLNRPLPDNAPIDPQSTVMVQRLVSQVDETHGWVNTTGYYDYGVPVYTVGPEPQPKVTVATNSVRLAPQFAAVPMPPDAYPDPGSDGHLVIYQPSTDTSWEFFRLKKDGGGQWSAEFGGRMPNVSSNPGHFTDPPGTGFGASATSIPLLAGLQRIDELQAGRIDHAVVFAMPRPAPCFRWPAQRQDGDLSQNDLLAPPEGSILRLPAGLDIDALNLPRYTAMLARAIQRYGMVLSDRTRNQVGFTAEDPRPETPNPFAGPNGIFGGVSPAYLLSFFPWDKLQVLAPPPGESGCREPFHLK